MRNALVITFFAASVLSSFATAATAYGQNGYYHYVIARGQDRELIRNMPIEERPARPLHVYGNMVRRNSYRPVDNSANLAPVRNLAPVTNLLIRPALNPVPFTNLRRLR